MDATNSPAGARAGGNRLVVLDYMKGIAVIWFTLGHSIIYWEDGSWRPFAAWTAILLDWTGPGLFIAFTITGTMISIFKRQAAGKTKGMFTSTLVKTSFLLVIGEILNLAINAMRGGGLGGWHVFGANMITVIALAQLLAFGLVKLSTRLKVLLLAGLSTGYPVVLIACLAAIGYDGNGYLPVSAGMLVTPSFIAYYLLFHMEAMAPTWSWLITAVLASILFDRYARHFVEQGASSTDAAVEAQQARRLLLLGCTCIAMAMLAGGFVTFRGIDMSAWLYDWTGGNPAGGLPLFLIRHVPNYLVFNAGLLAITVGLLHYHSTARGKQFPFQTTVSRMGTYSLSIFMYGHALALIPIRLDVIAWAIVMTIVIVLIAALVNPWETRAKGAGSLEWLLTMYVGIITSARRRGSRQPV